MLQNYEKEQKLLTQEVTDSQQTLQEANQKITDLRLLLRTLREMTDIPTEQEILAMMEEIRENPQDFRFVA